MASNPKNRRKKEDPVAKALQAFEKNQKKVAQAPRVPSTPKVESIVEKQTWNRKRVEFLAMIGTSIFLALVIVLAWYTDGRLITSPLNTLIALQTPSSIGIRDKAINCEMANNKRTPYCIERKGEFKKQWDSISRHHEGRASQFSLHNK